MQAQDVLPQLQAIAPTVLVPRTVTAWQDQLERIADVLGRRTRCRRCWSFALDPVLQEAGNARLVSTGDAFELSPELLGGVENAPNVQLIDLGGPPLEQLRADPVVGKLPAVAGGRAVVLPAFVYRPDYPSVLLALDELEKAYRRA